MEKLHLDPVKTWWFDYRTTLSKWVRRTLRISDGNGGTDRTSVLGMIATVVGVLLVTTLLANLYYQLWFDEPPVEYYNLPLQVMGGELYPGGYIEVEPIGYKHTDAPGELIRQYICDGELIRGPNSEPRRFDGNPPGPFQNTIRIPLEPNLPEEGCDELALSIRLTYFVAADIERYARITIEPFSTTHTPKED